MDEVMRRCGVCGESKPMEAFAWRRRKKVQRDSMCRECRRAYGRKHYEANRERYIQNAAALRRKNRVERTAYLIEYFESHSCVVCGESDPVVLEFDHLRDKEFDVCQGLAERSWQSVLNEIAKCDVVCANCHRRRTAERRGSVRVILTQGAKSAE